jgi:erythromycin esterase-like protein
MYEMCSVFFGIVRDMIQHKSCDSLSRMTHIMYHWPHQDESISDALVHGLSCASRCNHATRTNEPLLSYLQHGDVMNQTEAYGSLRAIVNNHASAKEMRDTTMLEWMRHVVRHKLHKLYEDMVEAFSTL